VGGAFLWRFSQILLAPAVSFVTFIFQFCCWRPFGGTSPVLWFRSQHDEELKMMVRSDAKSRAFLEAGETEMISSRFSIFSITVVPQSDDASKSDLNGQYHIQTRLPELVCCMRGVGGHSRHSDL
jgi:hypothetical protein